MVREGQCYPVGGVVTESNQSCGADRNRIGAERERLRDICTAANPPQHNQLHLAVHPQLDQG
ncbi:MAG TPA: hypothetical protein VG294_01825 [Solirubrobacteraceae bacterium]|nr:hypothetical protein [Solirubrobacteraceae bacterium]